MDFLIFLKIWNYLMGYLVIRVDGLSLEKFINLCVSRGVKLWAINRISYTSLTARIGIKDFKTLPSIVRIVPCRIKIVDKNGFPFLAYRFRHRKMLVIGMLIFLIILYILSSFIWVVEVKGLTKMDKEIIYEFLEQKGISPGVYKGSLNLWDIENQLLIELPELSWASIELKGTKAIVRVVEGVKPPKLIDTSTPCNIVASKDAIIEQPIVMEGELMVEVGDTVRKGQLLVSGIIEHQDTQMVRYVHAKANIWARTWYEGVGQADFQSISKKRTGKKITHKLLETKNWQININTQDIPFDEYEIEEKRHHILGNNFNLKLAWVIREYHEVKKNPSREKDKLAKEIAAEKAMEDALKKIPSGAKVIDKKFKYDIIKDIGYEAVVYVEVLEDIAEQIELSVN